VNKEEEEEAGTDGDYCMKEKIKWEKRLLPLGEAKGVC